MKKPIARSPEIGAHFLSFNLTSTLICSIVSSRRPVEHYRRAPGYLSLALIPDNAELGLFIYSKP